MRSSFSSARAMESASVSSRDMVRVPQCWTVNASTVAAGRDSRRSCAVSAPMRAAMLLAALLLGACSPQGTAAEADPCEDAITAAARADSDMRAAFRQSQESYLSHTEKQELTSEARGLLFRWATIVDQNGDCFDANTRATAAQVLHEFGD